VQQALIIDLGWDAWVLLLPFSRGHYAGRNILKGIAELTDLPHPDWGSGIIEGTPQRLDVQLVDDAPHVLVRVKNRPFRK
jgi:hypothetical protein